MHCAYAQGDKQNSQSSARLWRMAQYVNSRLAPGVREDPRLVRESLDVRASAAVGKWLGAHRGSASPCGAVVAGGVEGVRALIPAVCFAGRPTTASAGNWVLEPITFEGRPYLVDRRTAAVYADTNEDQYPELVGKWVDGRVVLRGRNVVVDLFSSLDRYLREQKVRRYCTYLPEWDKLLQQPCS